MAFLRIVHRWLGLIVGVVFALVALSGGMLLFKDDLYRWAHPELFRPLTEVQLHT